MENETINNEETTEINNEELRIENEEKNDFEDKYKRALADFQNLQKQNIREREDYIKYANENFLHEILPVYENLKTSVAHFKESEKDQSAWLEGIKYILKQFKDALTNLGVEEIETIGKEFDHNTMEAMEGEGNIVKKEVSGGYKLKGKVLIAARVIL